MKNRKQYLIVVLALILALTLSLGIFMACKQTHECQSKCDICNNCTNLDCEEDACKDKCQGHETPTPTPTNPAYVKDMDISENTNNFEPFQIPTPEAGQKQVIFYWRESGHSYADNDIWSWNDGAEGRAFEFHECSYGAVAVVNVPSTITSVGFIVRKDATTHTASWDNAGKVYEPNRFATLTGDVTVIYLTGANAYQFTSNDGGKTLTMIKYVSKLTISTLKKIEYGVVPSIKLEDMSQITVKCNGQPVEIETISSLNKTAASGTITLKDEIDLTKNYEVTIEGYDAKMALPMGVFDSQEFSEKYNYDGELGAIVRDGNVDFKLWAPTASNVVLNIFDAGNGGVATQTITMTLGDKGVWSHTAEIDVVGKYYTYTVTTAAGVQEAVDPYAKSAGVNGNRGMIINLEDTNPTGFVDSEVIELASYTDAVIWETHVRDFSNNIATSQYKGKYLAFTETGLTNSAGIPVGVDYVKNLGITHIHLLPVFDYASVNEDVKANPDAATQFNWGYDPKNYNVPEGSYSTNPYDGRVRVMEFKQMVQALHNQGLGVIMDVVYNHTYDDNSNLNKVVPNYYYRYNADGSNSSGSGCGNDTASERYMYSKYMVDSVTYWVSEYKLDGLRFDLMGLHDIPTMQAIEKAVHAINPNAIIYGEGWTMTTAAKSGTVMATQTNIKQVKASTGAAGAIAVFNDAIRDGVRGSVFSASALGYVSTGVNKADVAFGLQGGERSVTGASAGWTVSSAGVINYISAHDNHTLWDRLHTPYLPENIDAGVTVPTNDVFLARNRLGATIVMLSKGTPFMTAGEEMLRTKVNADGTFNENSYNASDELNNLKWENLTADSDEFAMYNYYKGLIAMRTGLPYFHDKNVSVTTDISNSYIVVKYTYRGNLAAVAVINGTSSACSYTLPAGTWSLICDGTQAGTAELAEATAGQAVTVPACSAHVYVVK